MTRWQRIRNHPQDVSSKSTLCQEILPYSSPRPMSCSTQPVLWISSAMLSSIQGKRRRSPHPLLMPGMHKFRGFWHCWRETFNNLHWMSISFIATSLVWQPQWEMQKMSQCPTGTMSHPYLEIWLDSAIRLRILRQTLVTPVTQVLQVHPDGPGDLLGAALDSSGIGMSRRVSFTLRVVPKCRSTYFGRLASGKMRKQMKKMMTGFAWGKWY